MGKVSVSGMTLSIAIFDIQGLISKLMPFMLQCQETTLGK